MSDKEARFLDYLASRKLRMTLERRAVLSVALDIHEHFTADLLYLRLKRKYPQVSRATVYRTLEHLVGSGLLERVDLGGQKAYYENFFGRAHHDHLICLRCGEISEFANNTIEDLQKTVCQEHQFEPHHHSHRIFGHCRKCQ